uniref:KIAA0513 n=1 Tax=Scophthalmus maximus TaxID=52904 RepID=A0A8D3ED61_SCOMX
MEGVAVQNLIDFDLPSEATALGLDAEPMAPTKHHHHHQRQEEGGDDSDATESADSENDMDPPSHTWELRRSSSSSAHSREDGDAEALEGRNFMKAYVEKVFHGKDDFDQEEKAHFGELCTGETSKGREWFAKYVSAQRCHSKCVSEATFYRLVQSFAVVLFECFQMDDYSPAKNLMTMCFTYYYIGTSPVQSLYMSSISESANSWLSGKKDAAERLLKNTSKPDVKGFFGGLENKLRSSMAPKTEDEENPVDTKPKSPDSEAPEQKKGEKVYLYGHLKQQPIWHTLRFWNAAFFDAVHCERRKRSPTTREKWCHMTQEERDDSSKIDENIAFGQLGTFTHNMLAFGLSKKLCSDFLKKQAVIGNLNEGTTFQR